MDMTVLVNTEVMMFYRSNQVIFARITGMLQKSSSDTYFMVQANGDFTYINSDAVIVKAYTPNYADIHGTPIIEISIQGR